MDQPSLEQRPLLAQGGKTSGTCLTRYLSQSGSPLTARQANDIQAIVKTNPALGFALLLELTGAHGSHQFDRLTKTKTVETILASMHQEGIQNYIEYLLKQVNDDRPADGCVLLRSEQLTYDLSGYIITGMCTPSARAGRGSSSSSRRWCGTARCPRTTSGCRLCWIGSSCMGCSRSGSGQRKLGSSR